MSLSTSNITIKKINPKGSITADDVLAAEEPLEIRLNYGPADNRIQKSISVTMRTPGNDTELAVGFLYTEGIIKSYEQVKGAFIIPDNIVQVVLKENINLDLSKLERNFYTTSSCGVCGKSSIDSVKTVCDIADIEDNLQFYAELIYKLPAILREHQQVFESTGGLHASAIFDTSGQLILTREDVGRHNALDKLIGVALEKNMIPLDKYLLLLSGRASFELIQKAAMAGIKIVAAVGAPSSLAAQTANEFGMTLIGFLRDERFNIYCGEKRILI
ncbi:MAG: formate dehydrogenase accessory sulfurtransferase FdhD [Bacteroidetes bacterium]|nr:formate dehydrogenase accessory sulfurtransferase FdhD [Bacteroidota bacterium]